MKGKKLTPKEIQQIKTLASTTPRKQIAQIMGLGIWTIHNYAKGTGKLCKNCGKSIPIQSRFFLCPKCYRKDYKKRYVSRTEEYIKMIDCPCGKRGELAKQISSNSKTGVASTSYIVSHKIYSKTLYKQLRKGGMSWQKARNRACTKRYCRALRPKQVIGILGYLP